MQSENEYIEIIAGLAQENARHTKMCEDLQKENRDYTVLNQCLENEVRELKRKINEQCLQLELIKFECNSAKARLAGNNNPNSPVHMDIYAYNNLCYPYPEVLTFNENMHLYKMQNAIANDRLARQGKETSKSASQPVSGRRKKRWHHKKSSKRQQKDIQQNDVSQIDVPPPKPPRKDKLKLDVQSDVPPPRPPRKDIPAKTDVDYPPITDLFNESY